MAKYIDSDAFLSQERAWYCDNCDRRKNSKGKTVYEIGDAPCRACDIGDILDLLEDYPAADAIEELSKQKWIPVTERLPEICERDVNGNITFSGRVWSCTDFGNGFYWQQTDQYTTNCGGTWLSEVPEDDDFTPKVVAWMPLPEPPKEET